MPRFTISAVPIVNEAARKKVERLSGAQRTANPKRRAKYSAVEAMSTRNGVTRKKIPYESLDRAVADKDLVIEQTGNGQVEVGPDREHDADDHEPCD